MKRILIAVTMPRHPTTGNVFRASQETAALGLAQESECEYHVAHVSDQDERDLLRVYSGFGAASLTWISASDPVEALAIHTRDLKADLVLTGRENLCGLGSGLLPYRLGARLCWPLVPDIRSIDTRGQGWRCLAAEQYGRTAEWFSSGPMVASVGDIGHSTNLPRYAEGRHEAVRFRRVDAATEDSIRLVPAPSRPAPLSPPSLGDYADRLRAHLTSEPSGDAQIIEGSGPAEIAATFLEEITRLGFTGDK